MPPCTSVLGYQLAKRTYCVPLQGMFETISCQVAPSGAELHKSRNEEQSNKDCPRGSCTAAIIQLAMLHVSRYKTVDFCRQEPAFRTNLLPPPSE
jgi:hypothetical protein